MYTNNSTIAINTESELRTMEVPATELEQVEPTDNPVVEKPDVAETGTSGPNGEVEAPDEHEDSETGPDIPATETNTDIAASENDNEDATATGADNEAVGGTPETAAEVAISETEPNIYKGVDKETIDQLKGIEEKIQSLQQQDQQNTTDLLLQQGDCLIEAKSLYGKHGNWTKWVKDRCRIPMHRAQRLMRVSEAFPGDDRKDLGDPNNTPVYYLDHSKLDNLAKIRSKDERKRFFEEYCNPDKGSKPISEFTREALQENICAFLGKTKRKSPKKRQSMTFDTALGKLTQAGEMLLTIINECPDQSREQAKKLRDKLNELLQKLPADDSFSASAKELIERDQIPPDDA